MSVIKQIHKHRSIRKYRPDPVPDRILNQVLEAAIRSSSSGNMQAYSIIITRDPARKQELLEPHLNQKLILEAPVFLTFCADFHRMRRWLALREAPDNFDNYFSFMVAAIDAILASQTAALAAESLGLGICYLGSTLASADLIGQILDLPENVIPVVGFALGYPAENPPLRDRLPFTGLVHQERYQPYSADDIQGIYQDREVKGWERYMGSRWLKEQVEEKGIQNLAQLYTRVKYTQESHQEYSRRLLAYLSSQGFLNNGIK